jgi:hypothetical protein
VEDRLEASRKATASATGIPAHDVLVFALGSSRSGQKRMDGTSNAITPISIKPSEPIRSRINPSQPVNNQYLRKHGGHTRTSRGFLRGRRKSFETNSNACAESKMGSYALESHLNMAHDLAPSRRVGHRLRLPPTS